MTLTPRSASLVATPSVSSPPMAIERVDAQAVQVLGDPVDPAVDLERVGARRAEDRAAAGQDAAHVRDAERHGDVLQRAAPAVAEADELVAVDADALAHDGTDHRVQPRAVPAPGQHPDAQAVRLPALTVVVGPAQRLPHAVPQVSASGPCQRARLWRASASASCWSGGAGGSGGQPASSQRWRSSWVNRGIGPRQRPHVTPELAEHDVVVGRHPRPQLDRLPRLEQERQQVVADPLARAPGRRRTGWAACPARCLRTQSIACDGSNSVETA